MVRSTSALLLTLLLTASAKADDPPGAAENRPTAQPSRSADGGAAAPALKDDKQKASYSIGFTMGQRMRQQFGADALDLQALLAGMQHSMTNTAPALPKKQTDAALLRYHAVLQSQQSRNQNAMSDGNKKRGDDFLAANKQKKGVVALPSGVQYLVLKEGKGNSPKATDTVKVHYHGMLIDGTVFDSSVNRGEPISFALNHVIKGWTEVVQLMKEGAKWRVFIPPDMAYGASGSGPIGPNETLIFEIELLGIE